LLSNLIRRAHSRAGLFIEALAPSGVGTHVLTEEVDQVIRGQIASLDMLTSECVLHEFFEVLDGRLFVHQRTVHKPPLSARGSRVRSSNRQDCNSYSVGERWETLANSGGPVIVLEVVRLPVTS